MIYDIRHVTSYSYDSSVIFARCALRLEPKTGDGQALMSHTIDIRPRPVERTARSAGRGRISTEGEINCCPSPLRGSSRSEHRAKLTGLSYA